MTRVLEQYFHEGPYRFVLHFGKCSFAEFYGPQTDHAQILQERREWLEAFATRHLAVLPEAQPLLEETLNLAQEHGTVLTAGPKCQDAGTLARFLGAEWEPDFLLLTRNEGTRLVAGCVCFPSSWALEEKIGLPIADIHGIVPALNQTIGHKIETFLQKLKPGTGWTRTNWGLTRCPDRNQHPARKLPRLDSEVKSAEVFFRVEEQSLFALPKTGGILFGIRIRTFPLELFFRSAAAAKLKFALETMPEEIARYKGLALSKQRIIELLDSREGLSRCAT